MSNNCYITILFVFTLIAPLWGQNQVMENTVSLNIEQSTLEQVILEITKQTDIEFSYSSRQIPLDRLISIHAENVKLDEALEKIFAGLPVEYIVVKGKIILKKSATPLTTQTYTISGHIRDKSSGEALIGATITLSEARSGTITNAYGFYSLTLPSGDYNLNFSYVGYHPGQQTLHLQMDKTLDISLEENQSFLSEVIVLPEDSARRIDDIHAGSFDVPIDLIRQKSSTLGESDLIKSLEVIPGVQLFRDGSTFFNVRGGDKDQNQILVDEAPIYNSAHLLGLFSSFMPEATKDIKLYKGDVPAWLGGRISSVMDIHTREGNNRKFSANGSLGLISGRLALEGPVQKEKSSFFLSGRRSYVGGLVKASNPGVESSYFSDFTAKTNFRLNPNNQIYFSTFFSKDEYLGNGGITWQNRAATFRWNHLISDRLFLNSTFYSSKYEYGLILPGAEAAWRNHIANISLKSDFTFYKDPLTIRRFGLKLSGHNINPGNIETKNGAVPGDVPFVPKRNATELSLYFSNEKNFNNRWLLTYGFRLSTWANYGRTIEYELDENYRVIDSVVYETRTLYNRYANLEPRFSLTYLLDETNSFKINFTRSAQYINLITNSISPFNNLEVWLPASINIKPQTASQLSFGWFSRHSHWDFQVEAYSKAMQNQIDYANQAQLLLNPHIEAELRTGNGMATGLEVMVVKKTGKLTGWLSYARSTSLRQIEGINNGKAYPSAWDRPHQFTINSVYRPTDRSRWSGTLYLSSGAPLTTPGGFYQYQGRTVPLYPSKNNGRLPMYRRYDLSWNFRLNKTHRNFNHFLTISVFNLFGTKNDIYHNFNKIESSPGTYVVPTNLSSNAELVATRTYVYQVVPSITYSFQL